MLRYYNNSPAETSTPLELWGQREEKGIIET